jgi:hypothetical protein
VTRQDEFLGRLAKEIGVEEDLARLLGEVKSRVERPEGGRGGGD